MAADAPAGKRKSCGMIGIRARGAPRGCLKAGAWLQPPSRQVNAGRRLFCRMTLTYLLACQPKTATLRREHHCLGAILSQADMSLAQRVSEVPDAYEHSNCSTKKLLEESGYLERPLSLTVGDVEDALAGDPNLTQLWLERGMDQRLAGGWGIEQARDGYRIQNYSTGQSIVERDRLHACAEFIVRYVGFIHKVVQRRPR
jgi:hypothetical protein